MGQHQPGCCDSEDAGNDSPPAQGERHGECDNANVHDQGNDNALAEFSAVLDNNAKCVGGVLWDTKRPDPEFTPEGREPDKEI